MLLSPGVDCGGQDLSLVIAFVLAVNKHLILYETNDYKTQLFACTVLVPKIMATDG